MSPTRLSRRSSSEGSRHGGRVALCSRWKFYASRLGTYGFRRGGTDPFVKLYYLGGNATAPWCFSSCPNVWENRSISKSLNPHWGEKFHLTIPSGDLIGTDGLGHLGPICIICVWDKDTLSADDVGRCRVPAPAAKSRVEKDGSSLT